jgi:hypothetical protein
MTGQHAIREGGLCTFVEDVVGWGTLHADTPPQKRGAARVVLEKSIECALNYVSTKPQKPQRDQQEHRASSSPHSPYLPYMCTIFDGPHTPQHTTNKTKDQMGDP